MYTKIIDLKTALRDKIPVKNNIPAQFNIVFYPLRG
jgi:hypothetical protein